MPRNDDAIPLASLFTVLVIVVGAVILAFG